MSKMKENISEKELKKEALINTESILSETDINTETKSEETADMSKPKTKKPKKPERLRSVPHAQLASDGKGGFYTTT